MNYLKNIFFVLSAALSIYPQHALADPLSRPCAVTLFIHGTVQLGLALPNITRIWCDNLTGNSWYERSLNTARYDQFLQKSDLMLEPGLVDVTDAVMSPEVEHRHQRTAAIHIMRAFHRIRTEHETPCEHRYYTFGWSGALSETQRQLWSEALYDELLTLKLELEGMGKQTIFELHGHSHGGQLILHLAHIHQKRGAHDKLFIHRAILSASPIYYTQARHATSPFFGTVLNMYSEGDRIQGSDFLSTPERRTHHTFAACALPRSIMNTEAQPVDVRLRVQHKNVFGHASFFILDRYYIPSYVQKRSTIKKIINHWNPLPLIALYPALAPSIMLLIDHHATTSPAPHIDVNFIMQKEVPAAVITLFSENAPYVSKRVALPLDTLAAAQEEICAAYACTKHPTELDKALRSLRTLAQSAFCKD